MTQEEALSYWKESARDNAQAARDVGDKHPEWCQAIPPPRWKIKVENHHFINQKKSEETLKIAEILLHDTHDLIHKAVGWALREVGKRCGQENEEEFLNKFASVMPRTMLRYAIERFPEDKKRQYMAKKT